jgi:hypothetical protein
MRNWLSGESDESHGVHPAKGAKSKSEDRVVVVHCKGDIFEVKFGEFELS